MPRKRPPSAFEDRLRIQHMLDAARDIAAYIDGRTRADLDNDSMLRRALTNAMQQIGEAAANVSDAGRARASDLPWGQIVAMRHVLVHVCWGIDLDRMWSTATLDVPVLIRSLVAATTDWPLPPTTA